MDHQTDTPKLFFFFIDGIGAGEDDDAINPLRKLFSPFLHTIPYTRDTIPVVEDSFLLFSIDATLDTPGFPQSATGQTTIMTGENASKQLGFHLYAFPNEELVKTIQTGNFFLDLRKTGVKATCANLYSRDFFIQRRKRRKNMLPVSALSLEAAGIPFRYIQDYHRGEAVFADISNRFLRERGFDLPIISPQKAANHILRIFDSYNFVFFEYFLTDQYGHSRNKERLQKEVNTINSFLSALRPAVEDLQNPIDILITSDHGNAEDLRTGDHTLNPVPFFFASRKTALRDLYRKHIRDLTDIKPAILSYFDISNRW